MFISMFPNLLFQQALTTVQPSAKREGFATVPDVTWKDIGALEDIRDELSIAILVHVFTYYPILPTRLRTFEILFSQFAACGR